MKWLINLFCCFCVLECTSLQRSQSRVSYNKNNHQYEFSKLPIPPLIYAQAPSGVEITRVRVLNQNPSIAEPDFNASDFNASKVDEFVAKHLVQNQSNDTQKTLSKSARSCFPQYFLYKNEWTDYNRFAVDRCSGIITTAKYVHKSVGQSYKIIVFATDHNNVTLSTQNILINVTSYNTEPPVFRKRIYIKEILDSNAVGTQILTVNSDDNDTDPYNKETYFTLHDLSKIERDPWFHPTTSPISINTTSGEVFVTKSLLGVSSPLQYRVLVSDGGSPQRIDAVKMTLHIRNMTAPRNVRILNITQTSVKVCWSPPLHGTPEGYLISYSIRGPSKSFIQESSGTLNFTLDQLESRNDPISFATLPSLTGNSAENKTGSLIPLHFPQEIYKFFAHQFCAKIGGLTPVTNYAFAVRGWASNGKISLARMPLTVITSKKNCVNVTCNNGVCQEKLAPPGFKCICSPGFAGSHCDMADPCNGRTVTVCQNGGTCLRNDVSALKYDCRCPIGYSGLHCEQMNACESPIPPCLNNGVCVSELNGTYKCVCSPEYAGRNCNTRLPYEPAAVFCKKEITRLPEGVYVWPSTPAHKTAELPCRYGGLSRRSVMNDGVVHVEMASLKDSDKANNDYFINNSDAGVNYEIRTTKSALLSVPEVETHHVHRRGKPRQQKSGFASRKCIVDPAGITVWMSPDVSGCVTDDEEVDEILKRTKFVEKIKAIDLASSVNKIGNLVDNALTNRKVAKKMIAALSNILNVKKSVFYESSEDSQNASESIMATLNEFTSKVPLMLEPGKNVVKIMEENLVVEAQLLHKENLPDEIYFIPSFSAEDLQNENLNNTSQTPATNSASNLWIRLPKNSIDNSENDEIRLQFLSFKDDRIFRSKSSDGQMLNRPVVSASVTGSQITDLDSPITYMIPTGSIDPFLEEPVCVYWDNEERLWSPEGVTTRQNEIGEVYCESTHLTSFSVLMDPIGTPIMSHFKPVLSVITYIGLVLSTLALIATVLTFALFRSMNRDRSGLIVMNLSSALLLLNLAFLGADFVGSNRGACIIFGALLHYAVAASFCWMLVEALNMYQMLVTVFPSSEIYFIRKRIVFGWGFPLLLVIAAIIWDKTVYFTEYQSICVISPLFAPAVYYTTYLGPVCFVLCINVFVFLRVLRVLCQSRPSYKRSIPVSVAQIRGAIAIVALLGITWLIGVFAVGHLRVASQFIFCLTTPFQGLIIFWVRVIQNAEARMAWKSFFKTGTTRLRPRPLSSLRTNSYQHSSSLHTQSTGSTPSKSVFTNALMAARRFSTISNSGLSFIGSTSNKRRKDSAAVNSKNVTQNSPSDVPGARENGHANVDRLFKRLSFGASPKPLDSDVKDLRMTSPDAAESGPQRLSFHQSQHEVDEEPLKELHKILSSYTFFEENTRNVEDSSVDKKDFNVVNCRSADRDFSPSMEEEEERLLQQFLTSKNSSSEGEHKRLMPGAAAARSKISIQEDEQRSSENFSTNVKDKKLNELKEDNDVYDTKDVYREISSNNCEAKRGSLEHISPIRSKIDNENCFTVSKEFISDSLPYIVPQSHPVSDASEGVKLPHFVNSNGNFLSPNGYLLPQDKISLNHRASSEQNIAADAKSSNFASRKSLSNGELDVSDRLLPL